MLRSDSSLLDSMMRIVCLVFVKSSAIIYLVKMQWKKHSVICGC
jgi:hypothetical protein